MNKTAELSQRRPRDAPNIWVLWKVLRVLTTYPATFPETRNGLLFRSIIRTCVQKLKFVALPVPEKSTLHFLPKFGRAFDRMDFVNTPAKVEVRSFTRSWGTQKILAVPVYAHAPFSPKFLIGFCSDGPWIYLPNLMFVALPIPEIMGVLQKFGESMDSPTLPILPNF